MRRSSAQPTPPDAPGPLRHVKVAGAARRKMEPMDSKRRNSIVLAAIMAVAATLGLARLSLGPKVTSYEVHRADVVQSVVASGRVESPRRVEVGSALVGTVVRVPVDE